MSVKRGRFCEIFTPAELGLDAVDTTSLATFEGNFVDISRYNAFLLLATFTNGSTVGQIRYRGKTSAQETTVAAIASGGSGYAVSDTITLAGGTRSVATVLTVTSVSSGVITGVSITTAGIYSVIPANPVAQASTSGSGTGATFNITWGRISTPAVSLRGASAFNFALGAQIVIACGPLGGVFMNVDATTPSLTASFAGLDQVAIQFQVSTGAAGTASFHLWCKTSEGRN